MPSFLLLLLTYCCLYTSSSVLPPFRPPSIPLIQSDPFQQVHILGDDVIADTKYWDKQPKAMHGTITIDGAVYTFLGSCPLLSICPPPLHQTSVIVYPTRTVITLATSPSPSAATVTLQFTETLHDPTNLTLLSRPVTYVDISSSSPLAAVTLSLAADFATNEKHEEVTYDKTDTYARIGTKAQAVLNHDGDATNINWGYQYIAVVGEGTFQADETRIEATTDGEAVGGVNTATFLVAYDDVEAVEYFGTPQKPLWTQTYPSIAAALTAAAFDHGENLLAAGKFDAELVDELTAKGGEKYAAVAALAYRQTWAGVKLTWNEELGRPWCFLKEISTNGDMSTMDVIFPASPFFLYFNADVLRMLLEPIFHYATNQTSVLYSSLYSPHQLGVYPIARSTTSEQEQMPLENSGNMFLMLKGLDNAGVDGSWYAAAMDMLRTWAGEMCTALPFPAAQLSTDDFMGAYANNTNLAAKGVIALEAFADIGGGEEYRKAAREFAAVWSAESISSSGDHYKMAFGAPDRSYSLKYNLLWQKLLRMDGPFVDWDEIAAKEVAFYESKALKYGPPLESTLDGTRPIFRTMVKLDWLSWCASMGEGKEQFRRLFDVIFDMLNETKSRVVMTDLWDTITGISFSGMINTFVARPVVGAVYAKMLLAE